MKNYIKGVNPNIVPLTDEERIELVELRKKNRQLEMGLEIISIKGINSIDKIEKIIVISQLRHKYPIKELLEYFSLSKSTYYYGLKKTKNEDKDKDLKEEIIKIYEENYQRYGYRRITIVLNKKYDNKKRINHKKVKRLMKELGLYAIQKKNSTYCSYKKDNGKIKKNLLLSEQIDDVRNQTIYERDFTSFYPNQKWVTDITEFKLKSFKLYLSTILDLYDSSIVSYEISYSPTLKLTKKTIDKAFDNNDCLNGLILHSDQGWQYQSKSYTNKLIEKGIKVSYSRKGNVLDNSIMENFFSLLKKEMFYGRENDFKSYNDLEYEINSYMLWYNEKRINKKRNWLSPLEYRLLSYKKV